MSTAVWRGSPKPGTGAALVSVALALVALLVGLSWHGALHAASGNLLDFSVFLALAAGLGLVALDLSGLGAVSVASVGVLATGFRFGVGAAVLAALCAAAVEAARARPATRSALFQAASFALAAGSGTAVYRLFAHATSPADLLGRASLAGVIAWLVSSALAGALAAVANERSPLRLTDGSVNWLGVHALAFGPLALVATIAFARIGPVGLLAFALPPALLIASAQRTLGATRALLAEGERANENLRRANDDLAAVCDFAAGLARQGHDTEAVTDYSRRSLGRLLGGSVEIGIGPEPRPGATALGSGGHVVGDLLLQSGDDARWLRLQDAIASQLGATLESAALVEELGRRHRSTVDALTRSLEAKQAATGSHSERVSHLAVALARRLGYDGPELDAIAIGASLHDIGKIGIPEAILAKPGPLSNDEWKVMKRHPVVSEFILSGVDLSPIVLQIARSSHERVDGRGYPDGLAGDAIPLPARIVLVADAFDALTSDRPYRRARRPRAAIEEILANAGDQFCPLVVTAFERVYRTEPALLEGPAQTIVA